MTSSGIVWHGVPLSVNVMNSHAEGETRGEASEVSPISTHLVRPPHIILSARIQKRVIDYDGPLGENNNTGDWHFDRNFPSRVSNGLQRAPRVMLSLSLRDFRRDG